MADMTPAEIEALLARSNERPDFEWFQPELVAALRALAATISDLTRERDAAREATLLDAGRFAQGFADTMSGDEATGAKAVATSLLVLASRAALGRFSAEAAPNGAASEGEQADG